MRLNNAALTMTAMTLIVPAVTGFSLWGSSKGAGAAAVVETRDEEDLSAPVIRGRRVQRASARRFRDGTAHDANAKALLDRATPEEAPAPEGAVVGEKDDRLVFGKPPKSSVDPTYEISYLSKSEDDVVYEDEIFNGDLRKRNPHEASCFDVPTFALNGILGTYPPGERCTHKKMGERNYAITCYHAHDEGDEETGGSGKRSIDDMHVERRMQFLSLCDTSTRPEMMIN